MQFCAKFWRTSELKNKFNLISQKKKERKKYNSTITQKETNPQFSNTAKKKQRKTKNLQSVLSQINYTINTKSFSFHMCTVYTKHSHICVHRFYCFITHNYKNTQNLNRLVIIFFFINPYSLSLLYIFWMLKRKELKKCIA